ncbi:hypothetical protein ALC57_13062 [Trachymyrmex cornetzi]|uniref:Uncharacterized protein n=1 Tax=Trachymyrmex cornetzi TaxID=471704 RepID=A0A151IZW1_9HYME|nr:hypothetical protein ALC57_13062 [Trachymyrmex cornetzi]
MVDILNITGEPIFDDRIVKIETHTYNPYANTTFGHSDEIRIPIQQQDLYSLPCDSFLYVEGRLTVKRTSFCQNPDLNHHGLRWDDGVVPYSMVRRLITEAVLEENEAVVYVKGHEKRGWLADMLDTDDIIVETLDAHYKDVESLRNLDDCNTIR